MTRKPFPTLQIAHRDAEPTAPKEIPSEGLLVMDDEGVRERTDWIVIEEPLEIRRTGPARNRRAWP